LVATGPFRYSRNPIYLADLAILLGMFLVRGEPALLLYVLLAAVLLHLWVVTHEEPVLARRFGNEWVRYAERVPRWFGGSKEIVPAALEPRMMLHHPFEELSDASIRRAFAAGATISGGLGLLVLWLIECGPGVGPLASLVTAGSPERAAAILTSWTMADRVLVGFIAGFDLLFGLAWTNTLGLGCVWAARRLHGSRMVARGASVLAWSCWVALLLDVPENVSYLVMVGGTVEQPWPLLCVLAAYLRVVISCAALLFVAGSVTAVVVGGSKLHGP
jgi:hypothetical protein